MAIRMKISAENVRVNLVPHWGTTNIIASRSSLSWNIRNGYYLLASGLRNSGLGL